METFLLKNITVEAGKIRQNLRRRDIHHGNLWEKALYWQQCRRPERKRQVEGMSDKIGSGKLQELEFFRQVPLDVIQTLLNSGKLFSYQKKEVIFHAGDETKSVYLVLKGEVIIYNLTKHGNRKILFILGPGHLVNHNILTEKRTSVFCEAACLAEMLVIPQKVFLRQCRQNMELMEAVVREYERYIWRLSHQLKNTTGNMQTERKIAAKLWKLGRDFGIPRAEGIYIEIEMTLTLLADLVGVPRETISRACKALSERGLLVYQDRHFLLPDPDQLAKFYKM